MVMGAHQHHHAFGIVDTPTRRVSHGGWRARRGDAEKTGYAKPCWRRSWRWT